MLLPADGAVAILKIMVGLRLKTDETTERDNVRSAFLGLGSERTPDEFENGVAYAVAEEWVIEDNGNKLKISRTGFLVGSN
jgi:hypothetical protein